MTDAEVTGVEESTDGPQTVVLKDGRRFEADVVIGADGTSNKIAGKISVDESWTWPLNYRKANRDCFEGLWSNMRETILKRPFSPEETGDLAYRGTFSREQLLALKNERINKLVDQTNVQVWLGPNKHAVFYPLRNHTEYNLVLMYVLAKNFFLYRSLVLTPESSALRMTFPRAYGPRLAPSKRWLRTLRDGTQCTFILFCPSCLAFYTRQDTHTRLLNAGSTTSFLA